MNRGLLDHKHDTKKPEHKYLKFVNFSIAFHLTTLGLVLFSGAYLNELSVSVAPCNLRIALSKGSTVLGASLPEDGSRVGFRNVVFFF